MLNISKKWLTLIGIPAILCSSVMAFTGCKGHGFGHGKGFITPERIQQIVDWKLADFLDEIDASSAQREQILKIKEQLVSEAIALHETLAGNHKVMFNQWKSDTPDINTINGIIDESVGLKTGFAKSVAEYIVEIHSILTPQQRAVLTEHIENHHRDFGGDSLN